MFKIIVFTLCIMKHTNFVMCSLVFHANHERVNFSVYLKFEFVIFLIVCVMYSLAKAAT